MKNLEDKFQDIIYSIVEEVNYPSELTAEKIKKLICDLNNKDFSHLNIVFDLSDESNVWALINKEIIAKAVTSMSVEFQCRVSYIENENDLGEIILSLNNNSITFQSCKPYKHMREGFFKNSPLLN